MISILLCHTWMPSLQSFITSHHLIKGGPWRKTVSTKTLDSIIGRLKNIAIIIPMMGHFLNNDRYIHEIAAHKNHNIRLSRRAREDLKLVWQLIALAHKGTSMNLLAFRWPTIVHIGDASEHGLGAFASHGRAWRCIIPEHLSGQAHINLLEFVTQQVISIWIDALEDSISPEAVYCALSVKL